MSALLSAEVERIVRSHAAEFEQLHRFRSALLEQRHNLDGAYVTVGVAHPLGAISGVTHLFGIPLRYVDGSDGPRLSLPLGVESR
ncbi:hypothetical protein CLV30_106171 [Haloactinopolyspora alba]|uniref:Uncharacterized protein n=1 Tax=Haloactinopolyspora alba TaxID=648780 RepID=A0A2P8E3Y4_9ACTN|nr:hypothetical protein [Haloactinopolyspora alba]PSL04166.1 hypothetical protein CLV30_106171 [Haloactinopolyspora alba]